jgi:hypothetical protein
MVCHRFLSCLVARTLLMALLSFMLAAAAAGDYYVSPAGNNLGGDGSLANPWKTIQYAVGNIFESGATLHVAAGTYQEQVIVPQIAAGLDLIGAGAGVTTIDASSVALNGGAIKLPQGSGFTIAGFTIRGGTYEGSGSPGGAIRGYGANGFSEPLTSAVVENNIIRNNYSYGYGYTGGGVSLGANSIVRNNSFVNNSCGYGSGAVYVGANSLVENNVFNGNLAYYPDAYGDNGPGAVEAHDPSVIVRQNIFQQNSSGSGSTGYGGAFSGAATVYDNLFLGNSAKGYNDGYGGAAYLTGGSFVNNTLVGNIGDRRGQASGVYAKAGTTVCNNIIVGGTDGVGIFSDGSIAADFNDIWNNDLGTYGGFAVPGAHDIHRDPLFLSSSDYHLSAGSPGIDAGSNAAVPLGPLVDMDGKPRIMGTVDMGAYEVVPPGDANGDGTANGTDLNTVLSNYNQTGASWRNGDFDGNGTVNGTDLNTVLSNYNTSLGIGAAVPEPSTLALLGVGAINVLSYGWQRRKRAG